MKKNFKITSLTAAALASVVLASANLNNNAKAAGTAQGEKAATAKKVQSPEDQAKANVESAQKEVDIAQKNVDSSKADLEKAKSEAVKPDQAYKDQEAKKAEADKNAENKKNARDDAAKKQADAKKLADEATPDAIAKAKQAVDDKNSEIAQKQQAVTDAQAKQGAAQKAIVDANADVQAKKAALTNAENAKSEADVQVNNAQDALDGTGVNEAQSVVKKYTDSINALKQNISHNKEVLNANNAVLGKNNASLAAANVNLQRAKTEQAKAHSDLAKANTNWNNAKTKLAQDQQLANSAAGFFKSLAEDESLTSEQREDAKTAYGIVMNDGKYQGVKLTWYDKGVRLGQNGDATSLDNMKAALNDLDNLIKVRDKYGVNHPHVSLTATAIAMMTSDFFRIANEFDHPIHQTKKYGPYFKDEQDIARWYGMTPEQLIGHDQVADYMSEKEEIDKAISSNLSWKKYSYDNGHLTQEQWNTNKDFWDNNYEVGPYIGHYKSMINPAQDSIGMAIYTGKQKAVDNSWKYQIVGATDILQEGITTPYGGIVGYRHQFPSFTVDQYKNLVNKYVSAIQNGKEKDQPKFIQDDFVAVNNTEQEKDAAKSLSDNSDTAVKRIEGNTAITKTQDAITNTNNQISSDYEMLSDQENKLETANTRLTALTASNKEKAKNFKNAQKAQAKADQELKDAKAALNTAKDNLASAKKAQSDLATDINNKQKAVDDAKNELKDLQARQSQLEGAHQALDDAKEDTNQAEKVYREAAKQAADAKAQLDALKPAKDAADAKVKDAQGEYDHAVAKLNDAKAKLDHAKQVLYDLEHPAIYVDDASEVQKPQTQKTVNTSTNEVEKTTPTIKKSTSVKIEFIHNSYVYTLQGKIVKRHGKRYLIRKGHKAVALHNAKIVKINGKKFYQIAKNEYVKVVNTVTATKKINVKAVVKGKKNHKVRTYSSKGKLSRHYVYGQRTYKFTAKKEIKGKTYYKVSGKNEWVPASKLTLK